MLLKSMFLLFLSLSLGYAVCVLAEKQKSILRTVGYTIGVAIMALTLLYGLLSSDIVCPKGGKMYKMHKMGKMGKMHKMGKMDKTMKPCPVVKK